MTSQPLESSAAGFIQWRFSSSSSGVSAGMHASRQERRLLLDDPVHCHVAAMNDRCHGPLGVRSWQAYHGPGR
jgi:hypothetical protein